MAATLSDDIEWVDIAEFLRSPLPSAACETTARSLKSTGAVLIRDPRVTESDADAFLDMMERYFSQSHEAKLQDAHPEVFYQVGATPAGTERPRDNSVFAAPLASSEKPVSDPSARARDPKWRFFWRIGERPKSTDFPELNAPQIIPASFQKEWAGTMDAWGNKLMDTVLTVAEMLALGLGLPVNAISERMQLGPHLLAPTGSDMSLYDKPGSTIAGYHYDLNTLTIHGRSRYPGLFIWTRSGKRVPVVVPQGYLLVQAGVQLEFLTGGSVRRGMHEVVVSEETCAAALKAREQGKCLWRVSSTLFAHVRSDASLDPLEKFGDNKEAAQYRGVCAGEQVAAELRAVELAADLS